MKLFTLVDEDGFKRRYQLQDDDDEKDAAEIGLYVGVPEIRNLDWDNLARILHNRLHDMGFFTMDDIEAKQTGLAQALGSALQKQVKTLYKE